MIFYLTFFILLQLHLYLRLSSSSLIFIVLISISIITMSPPSATSIDEMPTAILTTSLDKQDTDAAKKAYVFPSPPTFDDPYKAREYLKGRLILAYRIFAKLGFDEGVAGHITLRVRHPSPTSPASTNKTRTPSSPPPSGSTPSASPGRTSNPPTSSSSTQPAKSSRAAPCASSTKPPT